MNSKQRTTIPPQPHHKTHPPRPPYIRGVIHPDHTPPNIKLIAILCVVFALIGGYFFFVEADYIAGIFFSLLVVVSLIKTFQPRRPLLWQADLHGIMIHHTFHAYEQLHSFWVDYQPSHIKELSFRHKKWYYPYIKIPLRLENPLTIRSFMQEHVAEERHEDSIVDTLIRIVGI